MTLAPTQIHITPAPLTEQNLKEFERISSPTIATMSSRSSISTTDPYFELQARANGLLSPEDSTPSANLDLIRTEINRERESPEPDEADYHHLLSTVQRAPNEQTLVVETSYVLLKRYPEAGYRKTYDQPCHGFPKNVGFNNGFAHQPDMLEALDAREFYPFHAIRELGGAAVIYAGDRSFAATLSHLAGEWKGSKGNINVAEVQAAYDGAAMVYGRDKARAYLGVPDAPGHSSVSTFVFASLHGHEAILKLYAHYSAPSAGGQMEYHQCLISSTNIVESYEIFREGRKQLRNLQDHSKVVAETLRDELKLKWSGTLVGGDDDKDEGGDDGEGGDGSNDEGGDDGEGGDGSNDEGLNQDKHDDKAAHEGAAKDKGKGKSKRKVKDKRETKGKNDDDADELDHAADIDADDAKANASARARARAKARPMSNPKMMNIGPARKDG